MTMDLFEMQRFDPLADEIKNDEEIKKKLLLKRKLPEAETADVKEQENESVDQPSKKKKKKNKKKQQDDTSIEGFTVLGDSTDKTFKKVSRVLPYWLSHPDIVTVDLHASPLAVKDMTGLDQGLVEKLSKAEHALEVLEFISGRSPR